jgi:hypothetical protein
VTQLHSNLHRNVKGLLPGSERRLPRMSVAIVILLLVGGCARDRAPILVHYKPVAYWLEQRTNPDPKTRKKAVAALCLAAKADRAALSAVIESLTDSDAAVRDVAVLGLLRLGRHAAGAAAALRQMQSDSDPVVREHATKALQRIEGRR